MEKQSQKEEKPFLTLVIIAKEFFHLLPFTLDSISNQTEKSFEVIIVQNGMSNRDLQVLKGYEKNITEIHSSDTDSISSMLNQGLSFANGEYINFLFLGDVFLSKYAISYLTTVINEKNNPDVVSTYFLKRDGESSPDVISLSFSYDFLKKGKLPIRLFSCYFLRKMLLDLKGFDERYNYRESLDLFCRIFLKQKYYISFLPRVLIDFQYQRKTTKEVAKYSLETLLVVYRNFGFWTMISWWLFQDHFQLFRVWLRSIKQAFLKP